jgi:hypothetical protein
MPSRSSDSLRKDVRLTLDGEAARATREGVVLELRWPAPLHARVVRGASIPSRAGFRTTSTKRVPGDTLVVSGAVAAHWQGVSTIRISLPDLG